MEENKYYTIDDLSKYFGVSHDLIVHFVNNGTIKAINKGNQRMLIPKKDFDRSAKGMMEYLLSSPVDKKSLKDKINPINTFWIFGLGMGLGAWFVSGELFDLFVGMILGAFIWYILLLLFGIPIKKISRWIKARLIDPGHLGLNPQRKT
jgi:excisionase family DNA binding protein